MSINYLDKTGLEHIGDIANYKKRNIDYTTYTGTDLEIEDTLENKINFNNLYGQTEQDGTPTPTNPIEIKTVTGRQVVKITGKNLFNKNTVESGKIVSRTDGTLSDAADYNASDYIPMKENTTYTLTALNFNRWYSACYDENKNYIGYVEDETTFTTISGTKYMRFTVYNDLMDTAMIVESDTLPDTYEGYKEQSYELNLGKNLFDKDNMPVLDLYIENGIIKESSYNKMLYIPCEPNTTYTLQKIASAYSRQIAYTTELPAANVSTYGRVEIPANNTQSKITTGSDAKYLVCRFYQVTQDANISLQQMLDSIMIEKGEEATSYSPYFTPIELCEIEDYQDSIKRSTGKNLFDKDNANIINAAFINESTGIIETDNNSKLIYIPCKSNTTYTISKIVTSRFRVSYSSDEPSLGTTTSGVISNYSGTSITITTGTNTNYLVVWAYNSGLDSMTFEDVLSTIQIEQGSTATDYEPYGVGKWYVEKKIGKVVLDGSENWSRYIEGDFYMHYVSNIINSIGDYSLALSNHYQNTQSYPTTENLFCIRASGTSLYFENNIETTDSFKTWLSAHNVEVYYILATSTAEEITDGELIEQLNDLYEAFYMNSKTYINVEGDLPIVLEINHDKPRFLNLIDKGELQKYIIDLEKRVAIYWNHK